MTWLAILGLGALSFLFAGIEAGLLSLDPVRLRHHAKGGAPGARRLARLHERPARLLVTVLLLTNVVDIAALLLATRALVESFGLAGYFLAAGAAIPIYLFFLAVLPKTLFRRLPLRALAALGGLLESATLLLLPVIVVGEWLGRQVLPRRARSEGMRLFAAREELKQVAVQSEREGGLTAAERAMIHNVVDFRNVRVRDVMEPLAQSVTIRPQTSPQQLFELSRTSGRDRFAVLDDRGAAVGLVNVFDLLLDSAPASLPRHLRRILTVEEDEPAYRLIRRLRAARAGLAAVVDRERRVIGIATTEELIRRLVQSA